MGYTFPFFALCAFFGSVTSQTLLCDDIDTAACQLMVQSKPDLCQDQYLAHSACPRYCKLCPIECYQCNATVLDYHDCNVTSLCEEGEVCMIKELKSFVDGHHEYEMTCAKKTTCDGGGLSLPFVGRRSAASRDINVHCCDQDMCNYPVGPSAASCPKDIVFMVDQSSRVLSQDHIAVIRTLFGVIKELDIGLDQNLVGLYGYDTSVHKKFDLATHLDKNDLLRNVQSSNLFSGFHTSRSDTDEAVQFLVNHALMPSTGDRQTFPDAVVIIGDAVTARNTHVSLSHQMALERKSSDVIVVSVGSTASSSEVVATDNNHIIHVPDTRNFDSLLVPQLVALLKQC